MKVLALILSTVVMTVIIGGASLGLAFLLDDGDVSALYLAILPLFVFTYGPIIVGSMRTYFDPGRSPEGKRYFQRVYWAVVALDVLSAVAAIVFTVIVGISFWLPVAAIVIAAALLATSVVVGDALRKRDDRLEKDQPVWQPFDRRLIVRKIVIVAISFVVAFVVVTVALSITLAAAASDRDAGDVWASAVGFGAVFGFLAAGVACLIVALPITRALRGSLNKDVGRAQKFARLILRRKNIELTEDEQAPAARYASLLSVSLAFNLAYVSLLYAGILLQNAMLFARDPDGMAISGFLTLSLIVLYVLILPLTIRRIRRARKYASDHADLLPEAAVSSGPAATV